MTTKYTVHAFAICPVASVAAVNAHINGLTPPDGAPYGPENFSRSCPLNAAGDTKATTHYGCHWVMTAEQFSQLSNDPKLQAWGVAWDSSRGKVGDRDAQGKEVDRKGAWLTAAGLKEQAASEKEAASADVQRLK